MLLIYIYYSSSLVKLYHRVLGPSWSWIPLFVYSWPLARLSKISALTQNFGSGFSSTSSQTNSGTFTNDTLNSYNILDIRGDRFQHGR